MTATSFDARARTWDDDPAKGRRAHAIADAIVRAVPLDPSMRALEYGAGTGLVSFALRPHVGEVVLADLSDGMLEVAAEKIAAAGESRMRAEKLDLLHDPVPSPRFDVIYSAMTLHHIPDTEGILRAFRAALARPGYLCIADLDIEDGSFHGPGADVHLGFDRDTLGRQAHAAGFDHVAFTTAFVMQKKTAAGERTFPIFLLVARAD